MTVYHSDGSDAQGGTFANVGWTGWIGSITGMSAAALGIYEIGVTGPDATFGKESRSGTPFTFLLRDVLQFEAVARWRARPHRRRQAHVQPDPRRRRRQAAAGGRAAGSVRDSMQLSSTVANFINDTHFLPVNDRGTSRSTRSSTTGWTGCAPRSPRRSTTSSPSLRGSLTPANAISHVMSITQTGDLLSALYDLVPPPSSTSPTRAAPARAAPSRPTTASTLRSTSRRRSRCRSRPPSRRELCILY